MGVLETVEGAVNPFTKYKWLAIGIAFALLAAFAGWEHLDLVAKASQIKGLDDQIKGLNIQIEEAGNTNAKLTEDVKTQNDALNAMAVARDAQLKESHDALATVLSKPPTRTTQVIQAAAPRDNTPQGDCDAASKLIDDFVAADKQ